MVVELIIQAACIANCLVRITTAPHRSVECQAVFALESGITGVQNYLFLVHGIGKRSWLVVHLVIKAASIAEQLAKYIAPPRRRGGCATVVTLRS